MITVRIDEKNGSVNGLKAVNLRNIMYSLLSNGPQTKLDLLATTKVSASTVSDLINRLLAGGFVDACGSEESSGGRRPVVYRIREAAACMAGFAMTPDGVDATVTDMLGRPLKAWHVSASGGVALDALYTGVDKALQESSAPLRAIGVGVRGKVEWKSGVVIEEKSCAWRNVPLKEVLERRYGIFTYVDQRVNARAAAEAVAGAARHLRSFVCLYRDGPEKAALVTEGMLLHGCRGTAGKYHGRAEHLLEMLDTDALITDREDLAFPQARRAERTGPDFSGDCAVMAEICWLDALYDYLREAGH